MVHALAYITFLPTIFVKEKVMVPTATQGEADRDTYPSLHDGKLAV